MAKGQRVSAHLNQHRSASVGHRPASNELIQREHRQACSTGSTVKVFCWCHCKERSNAHRKTVERLIVPTGRLLRATIARVPCSASTATHCSSLCPLAAFCHRNRLRHRRSYRQSVRSPHVFRVAPRYASVQNRAMLPCRRHRHRKPLEPRLQPAGHGNSCLAGFRR